MESEPLYFITSNNNKFNEVYNLFKEANVTYDLNQKNVELLEIQSNSIKEVALFKLNSCREEITGSFFVEDAGFFIDIPLKGFPGVYSSYIFKTIGNEGIIKLISNFDKTSAYFSSVIALNFKPLNKIFLFEGNIKGKVSKSIKGKRGFGFDPIFIPNTIPNKTFAELSAQEKNLISHRGQALSKLISFLKENEEK